VLFRGLAFGQSQRAELYRGVNMSAKNRFRRFLRALWSGVTRSGLTPGQSPGDDLSMNLDHDAEVIAADFELSERLGQEILAADCEPLVDLPRDVLRRYMTENKRRFRVVDGEIEIWTEQICTRIL
jgi:hypothetical protein